MNNDRSRDKDFNSNKQREGDRANRDPITGAPESHPVSPGVGAATVGGAAGVAAAGAAIGGATAGPIGAAIGAVAGAVAGGVGGKAAAEHMDTSDEDTYWREHHTEQSWGSDSRYEDYEGAYRTGYEGYSRNCESGRSFDECESELRQEYERNYPGKLSWDQARHASRAAWDRYDRHLDRYIDFDVMDRDLEKIGTLQCLWSDHRGEPAFIGVKTGWLFGKTHVVPAQGVQVNEQERHLKLPYSVQKVKEAPSYDEETQMTEDVERDVYRYYGVQGTGMQAGSTGQTTAGTREHLAHTGQVTPEQATIQLSEEQLKVGKRSVEAGGVRLRKVVRTKVVNQPLELQQEEIVVERVPASEAHTGRQQPFTGQEVYIPLRREEAVVQKEARLKEEVRARKEIHTEQQQVSEEVRSEDVEIEEKGEARKTSPRNTRGGGSTPAEEIRRREEAPRSRRRGDE